MTLSSDQREFLATHRWALVATVNPSGTPQVTMMAYTWDGTDVVISTRSASVKVRNLHRNPRMAVTIPDDERFLTVTGTVDLITQDPARYDLTRRLQASLLPMHAESLEKDFVRGLDESGRVVLRLVPERVVGRI